jgi:hypothetical protein
MSKETFKSRVYTDRPPYADFDAPHKYGSNKLKKAPQPGKITTAGRENQVISKCCGVIAYNH